MLTEPTDKALKHWKDQIVFTDPAYAPELHPENMNCLYAEMYRSAPAREMNGYALNTTAWD